jgi:hypothetical protein
MLVASPGDEVMKSRSRSFVSFGVWSVVVGAAAAAACGSGDGDGGTGGGEAPDASTTSADAQVSGDGGTTPTGELDSGSKTDAGGDADAATPTFAVGGSVMGLVGTGLTLQNGTDEIAVVPADAGTVAFAFPTKVASGGSYAVSVKTNPTTPSQTCTVTGGSGAVASADVTSVAVDCTTNKHTVGGSISGLSGTIVLQNNAGDDLSVSTTGDFNFATAIDSGAGYAVTVKTQPAHQHCMITAGEGNVADANVTSVAVACKYRDTITVTSADASVLTNFQVRVQLTTSNFAYAGAKANGEDLRFSTDGVAADVPYWIESWNAAGESYVWLKVPSIPAAGSTKVYALYGDAAATAASSGDATFELFDDFEDGSYTAKWDVFGTFSTIEETAGRLHLAGSSNWEYVAAKQSFDYPVVVHAAQETEAAYNGLLLANSATRMRYGWYRAGSNANTFVDPDVAGGASAHSSFPGVAWGGATTWKLEVAAGLSGANIEIKSWCNLTAAACNTTPTNLPVAGITAFTPGFTSWANTDEVWIDLVHVRKYSAASVTATVD